MVNIYLLRVFVDYVKCKCIVGFCSIKMKENVFFVVFLNIFELFIVW